MGVGWYWELMSPCKNKLLSKFHTRRELLTKLLWIFTLLSVTYRKKPYQSIFSVFSSPTGEFLWVSNAHKKCEKFHLKNILNSSAQSCKMLHNFYYFFRVIHLTSLSRSLTYLPLIHIWRHQTCFCLLLYSSYTIVITSNRLQSHFILWLLQLLNVHILSSVIALKVCH